MKSVLQEAHALRRQRQQSKWSKLVFNEPLQIIIRSTEASQSQSRQTESTSASSSTPISLLLVERVGETIGSIVWEGCAALMAFLLHQEKLLQQPQTQQTQAAISNSGSSISSSYVSLRGKRVIELGAGVGILGCLASKLGALSVSITDRREILHVIRENISANHLVEEGGEARAEELEWGEKIPDGLKTQFDVILASDVVYNLDAAWLLLDTLKLMCSSQTVVYLAYRQRDPKEQQWFEKAALEFDFETVTSSLPADWAQHFIFQSIADPTQSNASHAAAASSASSSSLSQSPNATTQTAAQRYQNEHRPLTIFRMQKKAAK